MPELPEVETVVRHLARAGLTDRRIARVSVAWPRAVQGLTPAAFSRRVRGRQITGVRRRGKYIVLALQENLWLLIHLRMSGRLRLARADTRCGPYDRVCLAFEDGSVLHFHDPRKFGRWILSAQPDSILDNLGPEPLDPRLTASGFRARLRSRRRMLKPLLLDQAFLAGLGNIYVDESLWLARLHPCRVSASVTDEESDALLRAIRKVLRTGIRNLGTTLAGGQPNFVLPGGGRGRNRERLQVYGRAGLPCTHCKTPLQRRLVGQRGTCWCPCCQPDPTPAPGGSAQKASMMLK